MNIQFRPQKVIYDGTCPVCNSLKNTTEKLDTANKLQFIAAENIANTTIASQISTTDLEESIRVLNNEGQIFRGARGIFEVMSNLPGLWGLIGKILKRPPFYWIAEPFYRAFARHRHRFNYKSISSLE